MNWTILSVDGSGFYFVLQRQPDLKKITVYVSSADILPSADLITVLSNAAFNHEAKETAGQSGPPPVIGLIIPAAKAPANAAAQGLGA